MNTLGYKVLVVDDNDASRYTTAHALSRARYIVIEASTGQQALELANNLPAAMVLDLRLPDILGYEVCRRIKANPHTSHIPVLQLSAALVSDESKIHALESGADAYLSQPVEPSILIATVRALIKVHIAESQARLSGEQWQATFDALSEGIAIVDPSGIVQRCNRGMTTLLNLPYLEIENQPISRLVRARFGVDYNTLGANTTQEVQLGTRHFRLECSPVYLKEIQSGIIFIVSELTERRRAQAALVINERLAATGRMANTIAHEINNPLEAITNILYILGGDVDAKKAAEYISKAQEEVMRVSKITRQVLSFNRESKTAIFVDLPDLLEDVLALSNREIVEKNILIQKEWNSSRSVYGFPSQLRQVFSNLLRNAIEASPPEKRIVLRVSEIPHWGNPAERAVRVTFLDQGAGIPPQNVKRIFEAFFTTKGLHGSGIGLWLSSTIVQEHRGRIQIRSSVRASHSGTCFSVILPCEKRALPVRASLSYSLQ